MQYLDFEIDRLTHSIVKLSTGETFETNVILLEKNDLKNITKKNGWQFNWKKECIGGRKVYKLVAIAEADVIQGLIGFTENIGYIYMDLIETAPFNFGKNKTYVGVAGNLVAFACMQSFILGNDGIVCFDAKTRLIAHYEKTLGATCISSQRMLIATLAAKTLVNNYYSDFNI
jgi:hypothetical protein